MDTESKKLLDAFNLILDGLVKYKKSLSPRELTIMQIGMRSSHLEEALASGEFDRARSHYKAILELTQKL